MFRILTILMAVVLLVSLVDSVDNAAVNQEKRRNMPNQYVDSGTAGSWAIFAMKDPSFTGFARGLTAGDSFLDLAVGGPEWKALFFDVLNCPEASEEPRSADEALEDWQDRYKERFQRAIPEQPMLGRLWDLFYYVSYNPQEVAQLREECRKLQARTSNKDALAALTKIIKACDHASQGKLGLLFVPD
jgi:hypothetical protein